jgi:type II secretory ATPase GspE/PulE/Tfp pilus assembly ATPase PilB-like protein
VVKLIISAVERQASDIHITVSEKVGTVAIRTHGDLYMFAEYPAKTCLEYCTAIYNSMTDLSDTQYKPNVSQDARMSRKYVEQCKLFGARVSSGPTDAGSRMVIRLLYDSGSVIPTLEQLGYLPEHIKMIEAMRRLTSGVQIVSGATGSGKSTTLSSILASIIQDAKKRGTALVKNGVEQFLGLSVVTIEDPPEYKIDGAIQTPLITDKSDENEIRIAWARSISAIVRQDPDVIMVGEVRDQGSAKTTFDAALTGHSVWTTVHTTDAVGIMMRIDGLGVEPDRMLDPEIVTGLINQSLAQKLCPHCSIPWADALKTGEIDPGLCERVASYCVIDGVRVRGKGCQHCKGSGIVGRMVVAEVIMPNLEFMEVFKAKGKAQAKRHWIVEMGGITKGMALIRRINQGLIDPAEGERSVSPLDRDRDVLGVDYSINGQYPTSRNLTLPAAGLVMDVLPSTSQDRPGLRVALPFAETYSSASDQRPSEQVSHTGAVSQSQSDNQACDDSTLDEQELFHD